MTTPWGKSCYRSPPYCRMSPRGDDKKEIALDNLNVVSDDALQVVTDVIIYHCSFYLYVYNNKIHS